MSFRVYVCNWWRVEETTGHKVPDPGARKTTIDKVATEEEARARCKEYNDTHTPGRLSRKAEYTEIW
jgi:hypothetical protein